MSKHAFRTLFFFALFLCFARQLFAEIGFVAPEKLNANAATDLANDDCLKLATDGAGTWLAVWCAGINPVSNLGDDPGNGLDGKNQDLYFARSLDNGRTWGTPALLKTNSATDDGDDTEPDMATDGHGNWIVVWRSKDTLNSTIGHDCDILFAQSRDNGRSWSAPAALNKNAASDPGNWSSGDPGSLDYSPRIATDRQGHWVATWSIIDNRSGSWSSSIKSAYSNDLGENWSQPLTVQQVSDFAVDRSSLATDSKGRWIACWGYPDSSRGDSDIMYAISDNNGANWTSAKPLNNNASKDYGNDVTPALATDGQGHWMATWSSTDTLNNTIGLDWDILVSCSSDNGQSWSAPAALNQNATKDSADDRFVHISTDGQGTWLSIWTTTNWGQDADVAYAVSHDIGASWSQPSPISSSAITDNWSDGNGPFSASVATDQWGRWVVAWSSNDDLNGTLGSDRDILFATDNSSDPQQLRVLSPDGGEQFNGDSNLQIYWQKHLSYAGQEARVELWRSGKRIQGLGYISSSDANSTNTVHLPLLPEAADYKIRLTSTLNPSFWDESDNSFSIHGGVIKFVLPRNGVVWKSNSTQTVHWKVNTSIAGTAFKFELWHGNVRVLDLGSFYAQTGDEYSKINLKTVTPQSGYKLRAISYWDSNYWVDTDPMITIVPANYNGISQKVWQLYR